MTCEYCGRTITTSFVTKGILHWHAVENEYEQPTDRACWERSLFGTQMLFPPSPLSLCILMGMLAGRASVLKAMATQL